MSVSQGRLQNIRVAEEFELNCDQDIEIATIFSCAVEPKVNCISK